jgi:hypothetical protein
MNTDLIINTGIQFITRRLTLNDALVNSVHQNFSEQIEESRSDGDVYRLIHPYFWQEEEMYLDPDSINAEAYTIYGLLEPSRIRREFIREVPEDEVYRIRGREALDICLGHWIPLPYFRIRHNTRDPFHHGPEHWCRAMLERLPLEEDGFTHALTLAFDTTEADYESGDYVQPHLVDASDNGSERFKCVIEKRQAPKFFTSSLLNDWMFNLYWLPGVSRSSANYRLRHLGVYHVFIQLLKEAEALPEVGLLSGANRIEVGLTLDIGNSRTCGLICEKSRPYDSAPFDFTLARKLRIRNLSSPQQVCDDPFEMQVAFAEERFGNEASEEAGSVFSWPSLLRVGPEAIALTSIFESADYQATMSSPKRYLWDRNAVKVPWIKVDRDGRLGYHTDVDVRKSAMYGIAQYMTSEGRVIGPKDRDRWFPATESRYSRSSLMTMAIYEILLHAISQINDPDFRRDMGNSTFRRVLKDVVITCPTAMTIQEQYQLRKAAGDAIYLLERSAGNKLNVNEIKVHPDLPNIDPDSSLENPWKVDEATCSQLAYLYGELVHKFHGNKDLFFKIWGKDRSKVGSQPQRSVNIASIDIGGGTTDLMICNYQNDITSELPVVQPDPLFWEGFNIAGDDIVRRIIELLLLPAIETELKERGGSQIGNTLSQLFGQNSGGQTAQQKIYRRQFANQVAAPFAYVALDHIISNGSLNEEIQIGEIFKQYPRPKNGLIEYINKTIARNTGILEFDLESLRVQLNNAQINQGVRDIMTEVINQLGHLIAQFDCDLILLSGRPSRLPVIREVLLESLLFSPDKIVCLGDYRFGQWYPFANSGGYVKDPKSTVCVGALVAYLNDCGRLPGMRFELSKLHGIASTATFIGVMDSAKERINEDDVLVGPERNGGEFRFFGEPVVIGFRQLQIPDWIASPLYVFDFLDEESKSKVYAEGNRYPFKVTVRRQGITGEFLDLKDFTVIDAAGRMIENRRFEFALRTTIKHQLHWRDSGSFITKL